MRSEAPIAEIHACDREIPRHIPLSAAILLVIGNVIGAGIFLTSGLMLRDLNTGGEFLLIWLIGGLLSLCGCLTYAELGAMIPSSGGLYIYLEEAYGRQMAFLFGWTSFAVMLSGQIAGLAIGFGEYLTYFVPSLATKHHLIGGGGSGWLRAWNVSGAQLVGVAALAALGALNTRQLHGSRNTAVYLTLVKVIVLVLLAGTVLIMSRGLRQVSWTVHPDASALSHYGVALIPVLYAYEGWSYLAFAAGEVQSPARNIPRALLLGIGACTLIYLFVNVAYLGALPIDSMRGVVRVGQAAASASAGSVGGALLSATAVLSTLGCSAATIFVTARLIYSVARGNPRLGALGRTHPQRGTPDRAVLLVTIWSIILALSGTYEQLYTFVTFAILIFSVAGGTALFVLRIRQPNRSRPYRALGYPVVPALFVIVMAALALNTLVQRPRESSAGLILVALGLPLFALLKRTAPPARRIQEAVSLDHAKATIASRPVTFMGDSDRSGEGRAEIKPD